MTVAALIILILNQIYNLTMCRGNKLALAPLCHLQGELKRLNKELLKVARATDSWLKALPRARWQLVYRGGISLNATAYLNRGHKWAIIVHGYGGNQGLMRYCAKPFYSRGYSLLLPDLQAHGKSGGRYIGWGIKDKTDLINWCRLIRQRDKKAKIVLYGVSMGGAAVIMAAAERPPGVVCVIADSPYCNLNRLFAQRIAGLHLPVMPVLAWLKAMCRIRGHIAVAGGSVTACAAACRVPLMLCHGDKDSFVPANNSLEIFAAAKVPKRLLLVHGAGHGMSAFVAGERYWRRVFGFLKELGI